MPSDLGPIITGSIVLLVLVLPISLIARSTAHRIVAREAAPEAQAAYRRPRPTKDREELLERRQERISKTRQTYRVFAWGCTILAAIFAMYGLMLLTRATQNTPVLSLAAVAVIAAPIVTFWQVTKRTPTFPELPAQRTAEPDTEHDSTGGGDDTQGTVTDNGVSNTRATVASPQRKANRRKTAQSRRKNRRK